MLAFWGGVIFCQRSKFWISSQFIKGCKNVCKRFYLVVVRIIHNHSPLSEISAPTQHIAHHARGNKGQQMAMKSAVGLHEWKDIKSKRVVKQFVKEKCWRQRAGLYQPFGVDFYELHITIDFNIIEVHLGQWKLLNIAIDRGAALMFANIRHKSWQIQISPLNEI